MSKYTQVGYLRKSFGTDGMIRFSLIDAFDFELNSGSFIFLDLQGSMVPFMIERLDEKKQTLKFEWIKTLEEANELAQRPIYLSDNELPENTAFLVNSDFNGLDLYDRNENKIGHITEIREYPGQLMLIVKSESGEHLIPFQEDWVVKRTTEKMIYDIPEGMLSI